MILIAEVPFAWFAVPSAPIASGNETRRFEGREIGLVLFSNFLEKIFGNVLTSQKPNVFLETFPLKRKRFFEIYFVRLIGTPNQHIPRRRIHLLCLEKRRKSFLFSSS